MKTKVIIFLILITSVFLLRCNDNYIYRASVEIPLGRWHKDSLINFKVDIQNNRLPYDVIFNIRNTNNFMNSNLWLFVTAISPKGKMQKDTFECILADKDGKWFGDSLGDDIWEVPVLYKHNISFPEAGVYTFTIQQGMRRDVLENIREFELAIKQLILQSE